MASDTPSPEFRKFVADFLQPMSTIAVMQGFTPHALAALAPEEIPAAQNMLLEAFAAGNNDSRITFALGELGTRAAVPLLVERLPVLRFNMRIQAAVALWRIAQAPEALIALADEYRQALPGARHGRPNRHTRRDVVLALRYFGCHEVVALLREALEDEDGHVRTHATLSLMAVLQLPPPPATGDSLSRRMFRDDPAERAPALAEIDRLIDQYCAELPSCHD